MGLLIILGTAREGRESEKVAKYIMALAEKEGLGPELIDVRDHLFKATDNTGRSAKAKSYAGKVASCDAIVIVSPEYNHGYPGELKLLLDSAYDAYAGKKAGLVGVSSGRFGGVRAIEQIRLVASELGLRTIRMALTFPEVKDAFDEGGNPKDPKTDGRVSKFLHELTGKN